MWFLVIFFRVSGGPNGGKFPHRGPGVLLPPLQLVDGDFFAHEPRVHVAEAIGMHNVLPQVLAQVQEDNGQLRGREQDVVHSDLTVLLVGKWRADADFAAVEVGKDAKKQAWHENEQAHDAGDESEDAELLRCDVRGVKKGDTKNVVPP